MKYLLYMIVLGLAIQGHAQDERPLVVTSASIFADMAEVLGGNMIEVRSIVPIGGDPHIYEPTPADAQLAARADLVLANGLTFEGWLSELISNSGYKGEVVTITKGIDARGSQKYVNSADPHAWMDANNALTYIYNITEALVQLDPAHEQEYRFNYELYAEQIREVDTYIMEQIQRIPAERRILITSHDAFSYYGARYGLQVEAVLGTSTDAQVQTSDIVRLNKVIKDSQVPAVFIETTVNPKLLRQLAQDNDIIIGGSLYSDSLGKRDGPAGTYLDMIRFNTDKIVAALSRQTDPPATTAPTHKVSPLWWIAGGLVLLFLLAAVLYFRNPN